MKFLEKHKFELIFFLVFLAVVAFFAVFRSEFEVLSDRDNFEQFIKSFGIWAPLVIILSIVLEVVIAPLPGFVPAVTAGFIFGAFEGSIYTYAGNVLGSLIAFWIARKFGRFLIEKMVNRKELERYERLIEKRENILLVFYIFPIFPVDIMSGAFGLSKISLQKFALAVSIGFVFHVFILNYFGDYIARLYFML